MNTTSEASWNAVTGPAAATLTREQIDAHWAIIYRGEATEELPRFKAAVRRARRKLAELAKGCGRSDLEVLQALRTAHRIDDRAHCAAFSNVPDIQATARATAKALHAETLEAIEAGCAAAQAARDAEIARLQREIRDASPHWG